MPENTTGQVNDATLSARAKAGKLKGKENLTLAEKLILASNEDKFTFTYKDVPIEIWSPTRDDFSKFIELYNSVLSNGDKSEQSTEEAKAVETELYKSVADLCVDESITPELLESGVLGISFIPKLMNEIQEYQKREVEEVTAIKGFRRR